MSPAFPTVAAACDGTPRSEDVVEAALRLCEPGARLVLIHVGELLVGGGAAGLPADLDEHERINRVAELADRLQLAGVNARFELVPALSRGTAEVLAETARAVGADVIVVATRALNLAQELARGHVSDRLITLSPCPVLVARTAHRSH